MDGKGDAKYAKELFPIVYGFLKGICKEAAEELKKKHKNVCNYMWFAQFTIVDVMPVAVCFEHVFPHSRGV